MTLHLRTHWLLPTCLHVLIEPAVSRAGMPAPLPTNPERVLRLNDSALVRLQTISFFGVGLLVCAGVIGGLWNYFRRDFPCLPPPMLVDGEGYGLSHYAANSRILGSDVTEGRSLMGGRGMKIGDIRDGLSTTLLIGEVNANFKPWGHPVNWRDPARGVNQSPYGFGGPWRVSGAHFLMADASVRFVSENVTPSVLRALSTPAGGENVDSSVLEEPHW